MKHKSHKLNYKGSSTLLLLLACVVGPGIQAAKLLHAFSNSSNNTSSQPTLMALHDHAREGEAAIHTSTGIDTEELTNLVSGMWPAIEANADQDPILVIGPTGAGKTTFSLFMTGHEMKQISLKSHNNEFTGAVYESEEEEEYETTVIGLAHDESNEEIGHGATSRTLYPVFRKGEGFLYCDCPGFFDTRSMQKRMMVALSTKAVVEKSKHIKAIIFLITKDHVLSEASRGKELRECLSILFKMFSQPSKHADAIFFGFTKAKNSTEQMQALMRKLRADRRDIRKELIEGYFGKEISDEENMEYQQKLSGSKSYDEVIDMLELLRLNSTGKEENGFQKVSKQEIFNNKPLMHLDDLVKKYVFFSQMQKEHPDHFFIVDPLKTKCRDDIKARLRQSTKVIPKESVGFVGDEEVHTRMKIFFNAVSTAGSNMLKEIEKLRKIIASKEKEHEGLTSTLQEQENIENMIKAYEKEIQGYEKEIKNHQKNLEDWDNDKKVCYSTFLFDENTQEREEKTYTSCGYKYQDVKIELDFPFLEYDTIAEVGNFKLNPSKDKKKITGYYYCDKSATPDGMIAVFSKSSDKHRRRIAGARDGIETAKAEIEAKQAKLSLIQKAGSSSDKKEIIARMLAKVSRDLESSRKKLQEHMDKMRKNRSVYELIDRCQNLFEDKSGCIGTFCDEYFNDVAFFAQEKPKKEDDTLEEEEEKKDEL